MALTAFVTNRAKLCAIITFVLAGFEYKTCTHAYSNGLPRKDIISKLLFIYLLNILCVQM